MILTGSLPLGVSKDSMNLGMLTGATSCQPTPPAQIPKGHSAGKLSRQPPNLALCFPAAPYGY